MSKKMWITLLGIALAAGAWWLFQGALSGPGAAGGLSGGKRGGDQNMPVPVLSGVVETRDMPIYLDGLGTVQAYNTVNVKVRVDGELNKVMFTEGQDVHAGDLLAQIDPRPYQAQLDQAIARKAQDEALLANARNVLKRDEDLLAKKVLDQQTAETQGYAVDQLVATVRADQAAVDNAKTQVDYTRVTAPIDGRVGVRQVDEGNIVHAADQGGLVVITQIKPISVVFTLPEQMFQQIRDHYPQDPAKHPMAVAAFDRNNTARIGDGTLAVIDNLIDQNTATIKLKATFPNDDLRLWPGQFVNARLLLTIRQGALVVPASVIQRGPQGSYAFVIRPDQTAEIRPITVARIEDNLAIIDDGLQAGEHVVLDGQYKLQPGSRVEVTNGRDDTHGTGQHPGSRKAGGNAKSEDASQPSPPPAPPAQAANHP